MAIGSMTTNSTVDMIDKTLKTENAPADAAAVGDFILDRTKNPPQPIFYSKAAVDKLLAEKLGLHGTADNSAKWGDYERRFNEVTGSTHVLVETDGKYVDLRPAESIGLTAFAASGVNYVRLNEGTQICWELGSYVDGLPSETNRRVTFPVPFTVKPAILTTANVNVGIDAIISICWESTTGFSIGANRSEARGITSWIAIGRWK